MTFRALTAKQWFSSTYDKLNSYDEFRKVFTDLLWNPNRQAGIRIPFYLDKHNQNSRESYVDHYIPYANLPSSLDPPMTDMDLLSALTSHYEQRVQQGLVCGNFISARKMFLVIYPRYKGYMKTEKASRHLDATIPTETRIGDLNSAQDKMIDRAIGGIT
jgi:hypothetical protein